MAELWRSAIMILPEGSAPPFPDWPLLPVSASPAATGTTRRRRDRRSTARVVTSADGVTLRGTAQQVTIRAPGAALLRRPDGAVTVVGEDAIHVAVEPTLWFRGVRLAETVAALVPPDRWVSLPARSPAQIPKVHGDVIDRMFPNPWMAGLAIGAFLLAVVVTVSAQWWVAFGVIMAVAVGFVVVANRR